MIPLPVLVRPMFAIAGLAMSLADTFKSEAGVALPRVKLKVTTPLATFWFWKLMGVPLIVASLPLASEVAATVPLIEYSSKPSVIVAELVSVLLVMVRPFHNASRVPLSILMLLPP